jgi:hypothetical protein
MRREVAEAIARPTLANRREEWIAFKANVAARLALEPPGRGRDPGHDATRGKVPFGGQPLGRPAIDPRLKIGGAEGLHRREQAMAGLLGTGRGEQAFGAVHDPGQHRLNPPRQKLAQPLRRRKRATRMA